MVREKIARTCNDSEDFVLIGDEATDVSTHEQVSVCERFVECTGGKLKSLFVRNFLVL
jgi:histidinol phosphatase-like enzyme